jgi:hypothetical protein
MVDEDERCVFGRERFIGVNFVCHDILPRCGGLRCAVDRCCAEKRRGGSERGGLEELTPLHEGLCRSLGGDLLPPALAIKARLVAGRSDKKSAISELIIQHIGR